jgi:hypothetical protein
MKPRREFRARSNDLMPLFLLVAGVILALLGVGSIAAGAPDWVLGLSIGATLITSGVIALVGGLILIGLGQVLTTLFELQRRLEMGAPAPAPSARPAIAPPEGRPQRKAQRDPAPAEAGEGGEPQRLRRAPQEPQPEQPGDDQSGGRESTISLDQPSRPRRERPRETPAEEIARPRRPGLPPPPNEELMRRRSSPAPLSFEDEDQPVRQRTPPENPREEIPRVRRDRPRDQKGDDAPREFTSIPSVPQPFSGEGRRGGQAPSSVPEPAAEPEPYLPKFRPAEPTPAPSRNQGSETVVRSGVIGGMAYTLYADGSIEAELPIGTVRFNSIAELQDHVMRTGAEADGDFNDPTR